jgi:pyridoxamine 5'-phosphate oxidase
VDVTDLDADPLRQLSAWLDAARAAGQPMPEAMTIASATSDGVPSARLVVLRGLRRGLVFFTDCESDKGAELTANPRAAAVLHWLVPAHRQVRVAGPAERVSEDEADEYWGTRAPAVRLSAAASRQSRVVASRAVFPRPRRWGGFRVLPSSVEFWQESPDGLHDRIRYRAQGSGWIIERLSP